jgi:hypothetical protein
LCARVDSSAATNATILYSSSLWTHALFIDSFICISVSIYDSSVRPAACGNSEMGLKRRSPGLIPCSPGLIVSHRFAFNKKGIPVKHELFPPYLDPSPPSLSVILYTIARQQLDDDTYMGHCPAHHWPAGVTGRSTQLSRHTRRVEWSSDSKLFASGDHEAERVVASITVYCLVRVRRVVDTRDR